MVIEPRGPLVRRPELSPLGLGVCAGVAEHLKVRALWARLGVVAIATTGVGIVFYPIAWFLIPGPDGVTPARRFRARDAVDIVAYALIALGTAQLLRFLAGSVPWWVGLPIAGAVTAFVIVFALARQDREGREADVAEFVDALRSRPGRITRNATAALFMIAGAAALLGTSDGWSALRNGILALGVLFSGLALLLTPWLWRLSTDLIDERRARVRDHERAEMAAHLHDSVLQTLAMVQRKSTDPAEVVRLARRQERELREWLWSGQVQTVAADTVSVALASAVSDLETEHGVPIELVQVRDCPMSDRVAGLVQAAREAIANAQRHSGAVSVSVYCEVSAGDVVIFVRDRGRGFDRATVPSDRRGLSDSIQGRVERLGGEVTIRSEPDYGTEVMMRVERELLAEAPPAVSQRVESP